MAAFCNTDIDFWWDWKTNFQHNFTTLSDCATKRFVPMIWGTGVGTTWIQPNSYGVLLGYNEPDLWGPPPQPGAQYLSSGSFSPNFHCGSHSLAKSWQKIVLGFKESVMNLKCGSTNCWDIIEILQFHAYFYEAKD